MLRSSVSEQGWLISEGSARGKAHVDAGLPNQDAVAVRTSADGQIVAAVVSDGAGTAAKSAIGSRKTADFMSDWLLQMGEDLRARRLTGDKAKDRLREGITRLRNELDPSSATLREYHCTLVACLIMPTGGFVCQIGDSIALATRFAILGEKPQAMVDFFPDDAVSFYEVERGEYSNETRFVTEPDWSAHLRTAMLPKEFDALAMMTDGAMDVATLRGKVHRGFLGNLAGRLITVAPRTERQRIIEEWLSDRQTHVVTGDDKTIFLAIRKQRLDLAGMPIFLGNDGSPPREAGNKSAGKEAGAVLNKGPGVVKQSPLPPDDKKGPLPPPEKPKYIYLAGGLGLLTLIVAFYLGLPNLSWKNPSPPSLPPHTAKAETKVPATPSLPASVKPARAQVVVVPPELPIRIQAGDKATFELSLQSGDSVALAMTLQGDRPGLTVHSKPEDCQKPQVLSASQPSCSVTLSADLLTKPGKGTLEVRLMDAKSQPLQPMTIEIQVVAGAKLAAVKPASNGNESKKLKENEPKPAVVAQGAPSATGKELPKSVKNEGEQ